MRDERLVLDLCGYSHRASGGVVRRTNHEPISDDWKSTEGDRGGCTMSVQGRIERSTGPGSGENHVADDDIADARTATIGWTAARYILSVMKNSAEYWETDSLCA